MPENTPSESSQSSNSNAVECWLLPEISSHHVVEAEKKQLSGGYTSEKKPANVVQKNKRKLFAMTESKLVALEQEAKNAGFSEGRAEGYKKGYAEGEARAKALGHEQTLTHQNQLSALIGSVTTQVDQHTVEVKTAVVKLVGEIAQQLCHRELETDNAIVSSIVNEAINALPVGEKHISLSLNPNDIELLQSLNGFIKPAWTLQADALMQSGGCRIESENSLVEFSVSQRLQTIIKNTFNELITVTDIPSTPINTPDS